MLITGETFWNMYRQFQIWGLKKFKFGKMKIKVGDYLNPM